MNKLLELRIRRQIEKYKRKPSKELLESVFNNTREFVMATIKTSLKIHRRYRTDQEVLSMAWDVFEDAMSSYVKGANVKELFGNRAIIQVKRMVSAERKENRRVCSLEMVNEEVFADDSQRIVLGPLRDLREFRESLPAEYKLVFDDAIKSIGGSNRFKVRDMRCPLPVGRYYESKNVFQMIISYFFCSN